MTANETTTSGHPRQVMRRDGEVWTIVFEGRNCQLHDIRGFRYLAYLLARPNQRVAALEIDAFARGPGDAGAEQCEPGLARERARVNVTRGLATALRRLEQYQPELSNHLRATLRTGGHCSYSPDPRLHAVWET